eukprot:13844295-Alexandrium_andersonii.AAC.1
MAQQLPRCLRDPRTPPPPNLPPRAAQPPQQAHYAHPPIQRMHRSERSRERLLVRLSCRSEHGC